MYKEKMTCEEIWNYLQKLLFHFTEEEIKTLNNLFQFMKQDYILIQKFGTPNLQFVLKKDEKHCVKESVSDFSIPNCIDEEIRNMLISFNAAKSHMKEDEIVFIVLVLSMMAEHQFTIKLEEFSGKTILKVQQKNKIIVNKMNN